MVKNEFKVASVVILYNPELEVLKNIAACAEQTEIVFVLDNSDGYDQTFIDKIHNIDKVEYHNFHSNLGVAYALNFAAKLAIKNNFDFLLTMDQDSYASPHMVLKLLDVFSHQSMVGISAAFPVNNLYSKLPTDDKIHKNDVVISSGNLINLKAYIEVGSFLNKLFIDYVDFEFCFRLRRKGYNIYINNAAILSHSVGELKKWRLLGFSYYSSNHSALRLYYRTRNRFFLKKLYHKEFPKFFKQDLLLFSKEIVKIIIAETNKFMKLKMIIRGYRDYRKNIFGKVSLF